MLNPGNAVQAYTWVRVSEAARRLGVSQGKVRSYLAAGLLEHMDLADDPEKPGHRPTYAINPASIAEFIRRRTRGGKAAA